MATEGHERRDGLESGLAGFQFQGVWKSSLVASVPISRRKPAGNDLPHTSDIETRNAPVESALLERSAAVSSSTSRSTLQAPDAFELPTRCGWSSTQPRSVPNAPLTPPAPLLVSPLVFHGFFRDAWKQL